MIKKLWKYVWPEDRPHIRRRVTLAVGLLVASKLLNVVVPFIFGILVDLLNKNSEGIAATDAAAAGAPVIFALVIGCTFSCMLWLSTLILCWHLTKLSEDIHFFFYL